MNAPIVLGSGVVLIKSPNGFKGAIFNAGLKAKDWQSIGILLQQIDGSLSWLWGDWLNYGEDRAGNANREVGVQSVDKNNYVGRYIAARELSGFKYGTLKNIAWVCRRFPLARRCDDLSFEHHREAASLKSEKEQNDFLEQARNNSWSVSKLRAAIREAHSEFCGPKVQIGFLPVTWIQEWNRWAKQQDINTWSAPERCSLKEQLRAFIQSFMEFFNTL